MSSDLPQRVPGATLNEYAELSRLLAELVDGVPKHDESLPGEIDERSGHYWYVCDKDPHEMTYCQFCDGGLAACTICGGFEGSLTTICPGVKLTNEQLDAVYAQKIDFGRGFVWWVRATWLR